MLIIMHYIHMISIIYWNIFNAKLNILPLQRKRHFVFADITKMIDMLIIDHKNF